MAVKRMLVGIAAAAFSLALLTGAVAQSETFTNFVLGAPVGSPTSTDKIPCIEDNGSAFVTMQCVPSAILSLITSNQITTALGFTPLRPSNNLSDVTNATTSRGNLGAGAAGAITGGGPLVLASGPTLTSSQFSGTLFGGVPQIGLAGVDTTYVAIAGANLATGDNDLYTVPAGKKAIISSAFRAYNFSGGNITYYPEIKVSGSYYWLAATSTLASASGANGSFAVSIVLNAGESFSVNSATNAGLNIRIAAAEFDANETRFGTSRVLFLTSTSQTIFTAPAGKTVLPTTNTNAGISNSAALAISNFSGGSLSAYINQVASGQLPSASNQIHATTTIPSFSATNFAVSTLGAGDFISFSSTTTTPRAWAWMTYFQIP